MCLQYVDIIVHARFLFYFYFLPVRHPRSFSISHLIENESNLSLPPSSSLGRRVLD